MKNILSEIRKRQLPKIESERQNSKRVCRLWHKKAGEFHLLYIETIGLSVEVSAATLTSDFQKWKTNAYAMCKVSDQIKFCTCTDVDDIEASASYWILHQPYENNDEITIGMCMPPTSFRDTNFEWNEKVILDRLNGGSAFDKPFQFTKKDRLEVVVKMMQESYNYFFEYNGRKWKAIKEDVFELMSYYKSYKQGAVCKACK